MNVYNHHFNFHTGPDQSSDNKGPDQSSIYAQAVLDLHCLHIIELSCNSLNENIVNICLHIQNCK